VKTHAAVRWPEATEWSFEEIELGEDDDAIGRGLGKPPAFPLRELARV